MSDEQRMGQAHGLALAIVDRLARGLGPGASLPEHERVALRALHDDTMLRTSQPNAPYKVDDLVPVFARVIGRDDSGRSPLVHVMVVGHACTLEEGRLVELQQPVATPGQTVGPPDPKLVEICRDARLLRMALDTAPDVPPQLARVRMLAHVILEAAQDMLRRTASLKEEAARG